MAESASHGAAHPGHERTDAAAGPLARVGIAMAVLIAFSFVSMVILFKVFAYYQPFFDEEPHALADLREVSSEPRLQVDPPQQKFELKEIEQTVLTTYDWVDRERGVVRIPIDRAMDILAQRGLPVKTGSAGTPQESSGQ